MTAAVPASTHIDFGRHALAVLGATTIMPTLLAVFAGAMVAVRGGPSLGAGIALYVWLGIFVFALPTAGLVFTLAWPLLRRAGRHGQAISLVLGAAAGFTMIWTNYAMVGRAAPFNSLWVATLLGAVGGALYWRIGGGLARRPAPVHWMQKATALGL